MHMDEASREEHTHQSEEGADGKRERDDLQGALRGGVIATPAPNEATGSANQAPIQRPPTCESETWEEYWQSQGQPWRTEPEIEIARQEQLMGCLATTPDITRGVYPFKGMKLSRADVEWLLARREKGRDLTTGSDEQQNRQWLDLRGADLRYVDLHALPLTHLLGSLTRQEWDEATEEQRAAAAVLLTGADLSGAHLEESQLIGAHLEKASLQEAHLERADLSERILGRCGCRRARDV